MIRRIYYPIRAIMVGLVTTQILATIHVYRSNIDLYGMVTLLREAGYVVIPNAIVLPSLNAIGSAFYGGLFFTLSLGAGLSLFAFLGAWIWDRVFEKKRGVLLFFAVAWAIPVFAVNHTFVSPMVTAYFVTIPLVVFSTTIKVLPKKDKGHPWKKGLIPVVPIAILTLLWSVQADRYLFLDIRDFLLLSNPIGQKVDAFYYRYTLYPAHVFKTLGQKTVKACTVTGDAKDPIIRKIVAALIRYNYLPVTSKQGQHPVKLNIASQDATLVFSYLDKPALTVPLRTFLAEPNNVLGQLSQATDRNAVFRQATIICLLVGFPVLLYLLVFSLVHVSAGFIAGWHRASLIAAAISFFMGVALLAPLVVGRTGSIEANQLSETLYSENWRQRVSALRKIVEQKEDLLRFGHVDRFLVSAHLPERYWTAKALGMSRSPQAYSHLVQLLDDNHPNVVSMALFSLGQRRDNRAMKEIQYRLETSDHWYNQWYAYRALRTLGWRQPTRAG